MGNMIVTRVAQNLGNPTNTWAGWFVLQTVFKKKNVFLEKNAVCLLQIKPNHNILEVGFGPGIGLKDACQHIKDEPGKIYGIDISPYMLNEAGKNLRSEIAAGKLDIRLGSVMNLPYANDKFDRVFHVNCYYFWPNIVQGCSELYRVMKPNSFMVTTLNWNSVKEAAEKGFFKGSKPDMINYMHCLETVGFKDVRVEYMEDSGKEYQVIYASIHDKPQLTDAEIAFEESEKENFNLEKSSDLTEK